MLIVLLVAIAVIGVAVMVVLLRRGAKNVTARIESRLDAEVVEMKAKANFFGIASAGRSQVRGLGMLTLTPDELVFFQALPDREVRVPRSAITEVTTVESFLGKSKGRTLLKVTWLTDDGTSTDEAAWDIPDYDDWRTALSPNLPGDA